VETQPGEDMLVLNGLVILAAPVGRVPASRGKLSDTERNSDHRPASIRPHSDETTANSVSIRTESGSSS
jgi:hypothetical protein